MEESSWFDDMINYSQAPSFDFFDKQYRIVALLKDSTNSCYSNGTQTTFKYGSYDMADMLRNWQYEYNL